MGGVLPAPARGLGREDCELQGLQASFGGPNKGVHGLQGRGRRKKTGLQGSRRLSRLREKGLQELQALFPDENKALQGLQGLCRRKKTRPPSLQTRPLGLSRPSLPALPVS